MSSILITGGAGFIGFALASRFAGRGDRVTLLDDLSRGRADSEVDSLLRSGNVTLIQADITAAGAFGRLPKDFDYVYHLAAIVGVRNVGKHPDRVLYVNAVSTLNVLEFCRSQSSLKRLFFSSTSEVYAGTQRSFGIPVPTPEEVALTIDSVGAERNTYLLSKIYGEAACLMYRKQFRLPVTIGRFHNVYGPRMGFLHVIPEMMVKISQGSKIGVASASHTRAMCYIDDAVELIVRACETDAAEGATLNVGNGREEIAVKDLVATIAAVMGKEISIEVLADTPGSPARRCPDTSRMTALTGFMPQVDLREGISRTYEWYKDRLHNRHE